MNALSRLVVRGVDLVNRRGKSVGVRLVKLTGKRPYAIHPKHLVDQSWHDWYLPYLVADDRVLDVGCSNGAHLVQRGDRTAARSSASTTTLRSSRSRAASCASAALRQRPRLRLGHHRGPCRSPTARSTRSLFLDVIEHLVPRVAVLREIHRVLKDDGRLLVSAPNRENALARARCARAGLFAYSDPDHKIEYTARGVRGRAAGRRASSRTAS